MTPRKCGRIPRGLVLFYPLNIVDMMGMFEMREPKAGRI